MKRVVILISGRGSNMEALLRSNLGDIARFCAVISNNPDATGLGIARTLGVAAEAIDHRGFTSREEFDTALAARVLAHEPDLVVLAGFMRVLSEEFVRHFEGRLINIHPSLLPAFPGVQTHRRALEQGVKIHGCTVHFVTSELDGGPIVAQAAVPVFDDDTQSSLADRVLRQEHRILPAVVRWYLEGRLRIEGHSVRFDLSRKLETSLLAPTPP
jgi:phosphoribosylglycinamide formyltransferase 1